MKATCQSDLIICLGDFNAVTWTSRTNMENIIEPYGSGTLNDNSERLFDFCLGAGLRIGGSWFKRMDTHRHTWFSNDGVTTKEIDHILVNTKWSALRNCRVWRSLEFDTDHLPVIATMALRLKCTTEKKSSTQRYHIRKLEDPLVKSLYAVELSNRFAALATDQSSNWCIVKKTLNDAATKQLDIHKNINKQWVSDDALSWIEKKRQARLMNKHDKYKTLNKQSKANLKLDRQHGECSRSSSHCRRDDGRFC